MRAQRHEQETKKVGGPLRLSWGDGVRRQGLEPRAVAVRERECVVWASLDGSKLRL